MGFITMYFKYLIILAFDRLLCLQLFVLFLGYGKTKRADISL